MAGAPISSFNFNINLRNDWPTNISVDDTDYRESLLQQLLEKVKQKKEHPWYSLTLGTLMPHLCALYTYGSGTLRLEGTPFRELWFSVELTPEQREQLKDPNAEPGVPESTDASSSVGPVRKTEAEKLLDDLNNMNGDPETTKEDRAAKFARRSLKLNEPETPKQDQPVFPKLKEQDPEDGNKTYRFHRVRHPNATHSPSIPASLPLEIKIPRWYKRYAIGLIRANLTIEDALPQVFQQVHSYPKLAEIWAAISCDIYIKFYRVQTPPIDPKDVLDGGYYQGAVSPACILVKSEPTVPFSRLQSGHYPEAFEKSWRAVIATVEEQFESILGQQLVTG
ncbi:hypothetical protein VKT23_019836 [Stygiomarasmius scandens]|uniref:Uncharacterized protein n=1 Tax=Marasmiellus scandens TaxID=2682957 RepID=A0ABR1IMH2_9AGAR